MGGEWSGVGGRRVELGGWRVELGGWEGSLMVNLIKVFLWWSWEAISALLVWQ